MMNDNDLQQIIDGLDSALLYLPIDDPMHTHYSVKAASNLLVNHVDNLRTALRNLLEFRQSEQGMSHEQYRALNKKFEDAARAALAQTETTK